MDMIKMQKTLIQSNLPHKLIKKFYYARIILKFKA